MQCCPWPLGAHSILGNLHGQHLAHMNFLLGILGTRCLCLRRQAIPYIQEGVLLRSYIYESRLHAGQDILHLASVNIAHQMRL